MKKHSDEFRQEAVRIALTSGLPRRRVAADLGIGLSTLGKWVSQHRPLELTAQPQADLAKENEQLRLENRVLKEERDILKKGHAVLREPKAVKFAFVDCWRHMWGVEMLCRVVQVSARGYRSWRIRPMSERSRTELILLAHIREQYRLGLGSYGRPRMTMEIKEAGLDVGERRVGKLMRINEIKPIRTRIR